MGVFRGFSPTDTVRLAATAWDIGVAHVEVPIESPAAIPSLRAAVDAGRERGRRVGAGTIVTAEQLRLAIAEGAAYAVSPGLDPTLIVEADRASIPFLPGVATASEVLRAVALGFTWIKAFPASGLGVGWFEAMRGPFPEVRLVATGGMNGRNAGEFVSAGASVVGVGGAFADPAQRALLAEIISVHNTTATAR